MTRNARCLISASLLIYSLDYSILKNASTFGQIPVFTISVFVSDTIMFSFSILLKILPLSPLTITIFLEKVFWCETVLIKSGFHLQQFSRPRHKNKAITWSSSHPSHESLYFDSKLVVVVVEIDFMETRL